MHDDVQRVKDMQRLAIGVGVHPDRPGLKRELLGAAQGLPHAHQRRGRFLADRRLLWLSGGM